MDSGFALVVAAIVGAILNSFGAYLNDFFSRRRETQQAEREDRRRHEQWEREDRQKKEADAQESARRLQQQRTQAYKAFVAATPLETYAGKPAVDLLSTLDGAFLEVQMCASSTVSAHATELYEKARAAILPHLYEGDDASTEEEAVGQRLTALRAARDYFWTQVRYEAEESMRDL